MYLWIMTRMGKHVWRFLINTIFFCVFDFQEMFHENSSDTFLSLKYVSMNYDTHGKACLMVFLINTIFLCFWFSRNVPRKQSRYLSVLEIYIYELWHARESMFNVFLIITQFFCVFDFQEMFLAKTVPDTFCPLKYISMNYDMHGKAMFNGFLINTIFCVLIFKKCSAKTVQIPFCPWIYIYELWHAWESMFDGFF